MFNHERLQNAEYYFTKKHALNMKHLKTFHEYLKIVENWNKIFLRN